MKSKLYFAYGSNLNKTDWNNGTRPDFDSLFKKVSVAWLPNYTLGFTRRSITRNGGVLDIVPKPGSCVPGVLFEITRKSWDALCWKEGRAYKAKTIRVMNANGEYVKAATFQVDAKYFHGEPERQSIFVPPNKDYVDVVRKGLRRHRLSAQQLDIATQHEQASTLDTFFVYGTLRKGEGLYSVWKNFDVISERTGCVRGRLYDCGCYPAITLDSPKRLRVRGEVIRVRNVSEALQRLDSIEGYRKQSHQDSLYYRELVPVHLDNRTYEVAWIYEYARPLPNTVIESGDWLNR